MVVGFDPGNGRSCQRSFSVHGDAGYADRRRRELVDLWGVTRVAITSEGARLPRPTCWTDIDARRIFGSRPR